MAAESQGRLWTPANVVTVIRICFVPVFVVVYLAPWPTWSSALSDGEAWRPWVSAIVFVLIAATDALDGYLARSRGEVTDFGKFMDPLADKILVLAALLALTELGALPSWVTLVIMAREFIVSGLRMIAASQGTVIAASWYGKAKTVTQMIAIVLFILEDSFATAGAQGAFSNPVHLLAWLVMLVALVLTVVSMVDYLVKARCLLGFGSAAEDKQVSELAQPAGADGGCGEDAAVAPTSAAKEAAREGAGACDVAPRAAVLEAGNLDAATPFALIPLLEEKACDGAYSDETYSRKPSEEELALASDEALARCAQAVVERALASRVVLGTAESLTGGMICAALTSVPGSSQVVRGSVVSYACEVKRDALGVDAAHLTSEGAVTEHTACEMAQGACAVLGCKAAVAVTGIAGPTGAEPGKPVGTVWLGCSDTNGTRARRLHIPGNREQVRRLTVRAALETLLEALAEEPVRR